MPVSRYLCIFINVGLGEGSALPVGVPVPWPSATPPTGWLKCNGAAFSAEEYPELAKVYPTNKLPDLRGEFIRGWDDGRGVDAGRQLLSSQGDAIRNIEGIINGAPATLDTLKEIAVAINNDPKFSTTINNALALKAPLLSPALTGTPTAPTAAQSVNNTQIATTAFVKSAIAAMVGSAPAALDTLNELAAALGNDPNFATTMLNALAGKQPLDNTLTNLSGKDVAGLLAYLGLGEAAKRNVGTGDNQIPDMGAFASGSGWFRLPGGYIVQFGTFSGNTTRFISGHFPIPFPNQPMVSVSVMSDNVQSDPSIPAPQVLSVNFEHISNSAWRVATSDISQQYRFSYISIGR
ncbi:Gifsy-2 prophage tail fiber protein [Salmonella enterica subsp. enterica serovar Typhi]|nr:Gifsy-2 prophage tail fiber protein [Salmonella enterica subsp. enterica serovar Typhi]